MDNNIQDDIEEFFRISTKNDIKIEESINTVTDYYNKIQSLITKLDQLYQIELNTLIEYIKLPWYKKLFLNFDKYERNL